MSRGTLHSALTELLVLTGAQAVRVVDGQSAAVVAEVGATAPDDLAPFVTMARQARMAAVGGGGVSDLVLTTRRSVHVIRPAATPGSFLHVRMDDGCGNLAAVRRELASPALLNVVDEVLDLPATSELPVLPVRGPGHDSHGDQPALARLTPGPRPASSGSLAAMALGPADELPRRVPAKASAELEAALAEPGPPHAETPAVLRQAWARDPATLERLLVALRRPDRGPSRS